MTHNRDTYTSTLYDRDKARAIYSISFIRGVPQTVRVGFEVIDFGGGQESKDRIASLGGLNEKEKNYLRSLVWSR